MENTQGSHGGDEFGAEIVELRRMIVDLKLELAEALARNDALAKERDEAYEEIQRLHHIGSMRGPPKQGDDRNRAVHHRSRRHSDSDCASRRSSSHSQLNVPTREFGESFLSSFATGLLSSLSSLQDETLPSLTSGSNLVERRRGSISVAPSSFFERASFEDQSGGSAIRRRSSASVALPFYGASNDGSEDSVTSFDRRCEELKQRYRKVASSTTEDADNASTASKGNGNRGEDPNTKRTNGAVINSYRDYSKETKFRSRGVANRRSSM